MAHSNSPEIIGKKMCEKWRLWDLRIKPSLFAFLEVIYSGKKRIHEIVNAHTMPIPLVKVSLMGFHVSEGLEIFFLTEGWFKVGKQNFPKNIYFVRTWSGCFKTSKFEINFFSGWNFFLCKFLGSWVIFEGWYLEI